MTRATASALAPPPSSGVPRQRWGQLYGSAVALALAQAARKEERLVLAITSSTRSAEQLHAELGFFAGDALPTLLFRDWETLPYDVFSPAEDLISQRLATLYRLPRLGRGIVVAAVGTLLQRLPPRAYV